MKDRQLCSSCGSLIGTEYPLGFDSLSYVEMHQPREMTHSIGLEEGETFVPNRIIVPTSIGQFFMIVGIRFDGNDKNHIQAPIPAEIFGETAVGIRLQLPGCKTISLEVLNRDGARHRFIGGIIGSIRPGKEHNTNRLLGTPEDITYD